jgi:predicted negative regulator of RcsB-dependent stress response
MPPIAMNTEEKDPTDLPAGKPASVQQLEEHEVPEVMEFLKQHGVAIVLGVAIAIGGFVGLSAWQNSAKAKEQTAADLLANSQSIPQFQEIVATYGETKSAPLAMLSLAAGYFDQGQFDLARHTFIQFQTAHPDHPMRPVADLGVAQAQEAAGQLAEALDGYDTYLRLHAEHYLNPAASFGKARVLEALGRFDDARAVYEDFIAANPDSRWTQRAETGLDFVGKQQRAINQ